MLTPYGKEIRKLRIDREIKLGDMAEALGVSPTFLTAIETGRKSVPTGLIEKLSVLWRLTGRQVAELHQAAEQSKVAYKISVPHGTPHANREVVALFAKRFPKFTAEEMDKLRECLESTSQQEGQ